jgi:hypothetical protein
MHFIDVFPASISYLHTGGRPKHIVKQERQQIVTHDQQAALETYQQCNAAGSGKRE